MPKQKKEFYSMIATPMHVSESELVVICKDYDVSWLTDNTDYLKSVLFDLGLDTTKHFELQDVCQHRNRLGKVVTCRRYLGDERSDGEYLRSGFASTEALDKAKNCRMLDCLYRTKGLTVDVQVALESRDKYNKVEEGEE